MFLWSFEHCNTSPAIQTGVLVRRLHPTFSGIRARLSLRMASERARQMKADEVIWQAFAMGPTVREEYRWVASM